MKILDKPYGWSIADYAELRNVSPQKIIALARSRPLPRPISVVRRSVRATALYSLESLEKWWVGSFSAPTTTGFPKVCDVCGAFSHVPPQSGVPVCTLCHVGRLRRALRRRLAPVHKGGFRYECTCVACREFNHGEGTAALAELHGDTMFSLKFPPMAVLPFLSNYNRLPFDLQFILTEVFRTRQAMTPRRWAKRVRALAQRIHDKRGYATEGAITPEQIESLAKMVEALDD